MAFFDRTDIVGSINENLLDQVTKFDDTQIEKSATYAQTMMEDYLNARYDVAAVFAATGANRNPVVLMHCIALAIVHLHTLINPRKIPQFRLDREEKAMEWLRNVQKQKINPDLPLPATPGDKQYITFFGNVKLDNEM